ncbi:hypothetical protein FDECE_13057 [Fusarium decemcellulare]|nr:hypothetical protein FDECE_13057 [Fusarium decemcellulare]
MAREVDRYVDILEQPTDEQFQALIQIQLSETIDIENSPNEQHGLWKLIVLTSEFRGPNELTYPIDIIAIHGLGSDSYRTWQHENGFNWLKHLHEEFPGARVYYYGYDSGVGFSGVAAKLTDFARHLLTLIKLVRDGEKAIMLASKEKGLCGPLVEAVCALFFFATPHLGSTSQRHSEILCNIAETILFRNLVGKLVERFRKIPLESLRSTEDLWAYFYDQFETAAYGIQHVSCFIETSPMPGADKILVDAILAIGAGISSENDRTAFAKRGNLEAVEAILDLGIKPTLHALYLAAIRGHSDIVEALASTTNDIDVDAGFTGNALCAAASNQFGYKIVRILLEKGANVNWQGGHYGCALQSATANYRLQTVKLLLGSGADVNAQCGHGNALTAAARHRTHFVEMATLFLEHGADINAQGPGVYGSPLQTAVHRKHDFNVGFLMRNCASATMSGMFGSALDIAQRDYGHG